MDLWDLAVGLELQVEREVWDLMVETGVLELQDLRVDRDPPAGEGLPALQGVKVHRASSGHQDRPVLQVLVDRLDHQVINYIQV